MKKIYKYILVVVLMIFMCTREVKAVDTLKECSSVGHECNLICYYEQKIGNKTKTYTIYYNKSTKNYQFGVDGVGRGEISDNSSFPITNNAYISTTDLKKIIDDKECPKNIYYNDGKTFDKYCFDNAKDNDIKNGYCVSRDKRNLFEEEEKLDVVLKQTVDPTEEGKNYLNNCVNTGECNRLCSYSYRYSDYAHIYYFPKEDKFKASFSWKETNKVYDINQDNGTAFMGPIDINNLREAKCPKNIYKDLNTSKEVCFDNDEIDNEGKTYCSKELSGHFSSSELLSGAKVETLLTKEELAKLFPEDKKLYCDAAKKKITSKFNFEHEISEICAYSNDKIKDPNANQFFIVTENNRYRFFHYSNVNSNEFIEEITDTSKLKNFSYNKTLTCTVYSEVYSSVPILFNPGGDYWWDSEKNWQAQDNKYSQICTNGTLPGVNYINIGDIKDCESLLGEDLVNEIKSYMLYIKIAVPIIIIVMGSIDFGRAFIASDEEAMKKAQKRFIMRLIIGMIIFFIPTIVTALLNIANMVWANSYDTCGITF